VPSESIRITPGEGPVLAATLELPDGAQSGAALFAHCFTCTRQSKAAVAVSRELADRGIACLRFDFRGLGDSEGQFGRDGFPADVADVTAATGWLVERFGPGVLLVGHSLGGAAVLAAAGEIEAVAAVATIGAPASVDHVLHQVAGDLAAVERDGEGPVTIGGRPFSITREFIAHLRGIDLAAEVASLGRPLMILHSPTDALVGIDNAARLFAAAMHPKSFISLAGADHLLLRQADADFAATVIAAWASRYLGAGD
jgi:pimeloyl-ACP methyl ester carboxylesterase